MLVFKFMLLLLLTYSRIIQAEPLDIFDRVSDVVEKNIINPIKNRFSSAEEENRYENSTGIHNETRVEDYCSYTKLDNKIQKLPDPEECKKINEIFNRDENYNMISYDGNLFNLLKKGMDSLVFPDKKEKMNTIFFVGNTGSGKSTLVQILGSDNTKIYSQPIQEGSNEFLIIDNNKIGRDTITSQTLYPELLVDKETNFVLCDNPGFRDTRSAIHEIIAMYSMRKVLQNTKKIKIVIVSTHASLQKGMYRDDFTNLLKHLGDLCLDIDKYKKSIYLIGNKVENTATATKNGVKIVSDENIIHSMAYFLNEVKTSFSDENNAFNISDKVTFFKKSIKIINALLEDRNGKIYRRMKILRRPMEEGSLSEIEILQTERQSIRNMLLNEENLIDVNENDFGFALTESAFLYLEELFQKMNAYVTILSKTISAYIENYYDNLIDSNTDLDYITTTLFGIKRNLKRLSNDIGISKNPGEYVQVIKNFSKEHNLELNCLTSLQNITALNNYLVQLEELRNSSSYTPLTWNMSIKGLSDFIEYKIERYTFLKDSLEILSELKYQKNRKNILTAFQKNNKLPTINEDNFKIFLTKLSLETRYDEMKIDFNSLEKLNIIANITLKHRHSSICDEETLVLKGYFIILSELDGLHALCKDAKKIVILAVHTVFIDSDLKNEWLSGKDVTIIAPVWEVVGSRKISVDGIKGGNALPKANLGEIGRNGKSGGPGGNFFGIGMNFKNGGNLIISASGGEGQNGQEGGDGARGEKGSDGDESAAEFEDSNSKIYIIVNYKTESYIDKGKRGGFGGDSGAGGKGGFGGKKGSVKLFNIGNEPDEVAIVTKEGKRGADGKDGIPGKGGVKGCDRRVNKETTYFLFIPVSRNQVSTDVNCGQQAPDGSVRRTTTNVEESFIDTTNNDSPVCIHIMNFENYYLKEYHNLLTDGIPIRFINKMKSTKY
ncbi:uncharacterized protein LOC142322787 [Lycorma delicatula]|uniref:uncharacterized protein LOC142322787 n=1 Tax=Lycorma delicatula TaxID=130591 RepID=UPI003F514DD6